MRFHCEPVPRSEANTRMQPSCSGRYVEENDNINNRRLLHSGREHRPISPDWARGLTAIWRLAPGIPSAAKFESFGYVEETAGRAPCREARADGKLRDARTAAEQRCRTEAQSHANKNIHRRNVSNVFKRYNKDASGSSPWHDKCSRVPDDEAPRRRQPHVHGSPASAVSTRTGSIGARHKVESVSVSANIHIASCANAVFFLHKAASIILLLQC